MRTRSAFRLLLFIVSLWLTGCGTSTPPLVPVSGSVSFRGQPLPGGLIVFTPDTAKGSNGPIARGQIQNDGSFQLRTGESQGAPAGWHRITVVSISEPEMELTNGKYFTSISLIPPRYRNPDLSGLSREVHLKETNEFHLNLD